MERCKIYPNYINNYYYEEGNKFILLVRKVGPKVVYRNYLQFSSSGEAKEYFETQCGA